jgi:hypothetical protein
MARGYAAWAVSMRVELANWTDGDQRARAKGNAANQDDDGPAPRARPSRSQ